jgi:predicted small lipoprotein YifL
MLGVGRTILIAAALSLALVACGKKGALEAPVAADAPKAEKGEPAPHRPFVLDSLLR